MLLWHIFILAKFEGLLSMTYVTIWVGNEGLKCVLFFSVLSGDTLGSFVYVPCEVIKQRMQVQGTITSWSSAAMKNGIAIKPGTQIYDYYTGMFHAGCSIWKAQGLKGLYAGYTLQTLISLDNVILSFSIH